MKNRRFALFGKACVIALHAVRRVLHHSLAGVRVNVERERSGRVSHERLHRFDVRAGRYCNCRAGVPQIVGTKIRSTDTGGKALEVPAEGLNDEIAAQLVCKNQIVRIAPHPPGVKPVLRLPYPLGSEIVKRDGGRFHDAHIVALGAAYDSVTSALRFGLLQLLADGEPSALKIHAVPTETQAFALAQPRKQTQYVCVAVSVLYRKTACEVFLPLAITFGTTPYHVVMRLLVGLAFCVVMQNQADYKNGGIRSAGTKWLSMKS